MMSNARPKRLAPPIAMAFGAALALAGCASTFDALPEKLGGLPADTPARPAETGPYPNVYQPMAPREVKKLTEGEQKSAEQELLAMREHQNQRVNPPPAPPKQAAKAPLKKQAKKAPDTKSAEKKAPDKQAN
jgi:hypothetical protein